MSMAVALVTSLFTNPTDPASLDPMLLSPVIRRFLPKKGVKQQDVDMALLSGCKVTEHYFKFIMKEKNHERSLSVAYKTNFEQVLYRFLALFAIGCVGIADCFFKIIVCLWLKYIAKKC